YVVLEVSSFQLEHCEHFKPRIAVLLNLSPNHEDWHKDMAEYTAAKLRIFKNQTADDYAVFRPQDRNKFFPGYPFKARVVPFGDGETNPNEEVVGLVTTGLLGCGPQDLNEVLGAFEGIEHRLEKFLTAEGICFINDSKCTTTASLCWALEKFPDQKVILLAGGHPKSRDFREVRGLLQKKVKKAVLIGEARPVLRADWEGACPLTESSGFRHAVETAYEAASSGDIVLLSPACASFDMFKNYTERGATFKKIIHELTSVPLSK
ncbi:MAG TPA: Mur ligase family protein, partial [bacterium]|nr:Mur ligase family protein [bacterium]